MAILIDTDVAIHLRDGSNAVLDLLDQHGTPVISAITLVELEAGASSGQHAAYRRDLLAIILPDLPVLPFTSAEAAAYGRIVTALGFDRRRVLDRMIAAQAIVAGLPLATINGRDYRGIPDLDLRVWTIS
jgi:predicted nucleic acid-binding protein